MPRFQRRHLFVAATIVLAPVVATGASCARTELLRASFDRQFWADARYPNAELLGAWSAAGRIVTEGTGENRGRAHCDFAAQAVYGTNDDYEAVEAHYRGRSLQIGAGAPVAFDVTPVSDSALSGDSVVPVDLALRETLVRANVDLRRARQFETVYIVEAISWGHAPWLDWRCR